MEHELGWGDNVEADEVPTTVEFANEKQGEAGSSKQCNLMLTAGSVLIKTHVF